MDTISTGQNNKTFKVFVVRRGSSVESTSNSQDFCIKVPVLKFPEGGLAACNRNINQTGSTTEDPWADFGEFDTFEQDPSFSGFDVLANASSQDGVLGDVLSWILPPMEVNIDVLEAWSDEYYPNLICGCIEAMETACLENNIVELWGDNVRHLEPRQT